MKILAIESSSITASCAVSEGADLLGEVSLNHKKTHSEKLMPLIEKLMEELELNIKDIDVIAISEGPGSYTGLRIGASIAKSLSFAANIPIANIPTIKALAGNIYDIDKLIVPIMDAKAGRIYTGIYKWGKGNLVGVKEQFPCNIDELIEILNEYNNPIIFNGDGSVNYKDIIEEKLNKEIYFAPGVFNNLRASTLSYLAYNKALRGELSDAFDFKPQYLRLSQAERNKK
ncbi:tRNA (adenosine(37)-N6)-threonylcarbamoyltransferase complex dimerization subunit type 1 TsaB [Sedimentibacter hydroxybenzoicus DSM 7310]|uniref:tRNA (Adenosine(37)-N6)-threonylcarbamoyltransferase complex dimerization subunit type 1 TsaB n=1 Tax=Sedimentibacter hydroxybenzoicus DSM 7310 TaxID=1123245 RepID=A0A974BIP1_SEDHY|nr:tRNA (adenosine(37)-N6)-threonylcarbamoyltransferase complex dimerization subunit type 1 TsaB [Sedimentibacter hydroxybenzoicus]NYB73909.1 tRNA (adenosine(37)-N6)-threonylcarbamoyltransferase complex dimerization subunit type 1 TsaB [Sedimentibacter hydroxybenzoicus DSM 7310]